MKNSTILMAVLAMVIAVCGLSTANAAVVTGVTLQEPIPVHNTNRPPINTINGSGLIAGLHDRLVSNHFLVGIVSPPAYQITWDLEAEYDLTSFDVWNYNEQNDVERATKDLTISVASEDQVFSSVGAFVFAPVANGPPTNHTAAENFAFNHSRVRYVRFDATSSHGNSQFVGLAEVEFNGTIIDQGTPTDGWGVDNDGLWGTASNWSSFSVPDSNASVAGFGSVITAPRTVTNNSAVEVNGINIGFDDVNGTQQSYTIAGSGSVTLVPNGSTLPSVFVVGGSHEITVDVSFSDSGSVNVASGSSLAFNNTLSLNGNTLTKGGDGTLNLNGTVNGGSVVMAAGVLGGTGTVNGNLTNTNGTVSPGLSPGTLSVTGDYLQAGGSLLIELDGLTAGAEHDVLDVTGNLTISGGSLDVMIGFAASPGDSFNILNGSTIDTSGATINLPELGGGLVWVTSALDTTGAISLAALGDFNADGAIDSLDSDIMKAFWLQTVPIATSGDVTGDGFVDLDDFSLFKETLLGTLPSSASASAVPEPNSLVLLLAVIPAWLVRRSRRRMA